MISLSVTFFVQIINFFICWYLLDRLLFRTCTTELFKEEAIKQEHKDQLIHEERLLDRAIQEQHACKEEGRRNYMQQLPKLDRERVEKIVSGHSFVHIQQCDLQTEKMITEELVNSLVKRITRG